MFERRIWSDGLRHRGFSRRAPGTLRCALAVSKRNTVSAYFILKDRNFLGITSRVEINRNLSVKVRALDLFPDWLFTWKAVTVLLPWRRCRTSGRSDPWFFRMYDRIRNQNRKQATGWQMLNFEASEWWDCVQFSPSSFASLPFSSFAVSQTFHFLQWL